jgi:pimeloyl-ACP methyl ester carboxylesterase
LTGNYFASTQKGLRPSASDNENSKFMARTKRLARSFYRLLLPVVVLLLLATAAASVWLVHKSANPPKSVYLVTPEKYGLLSTRGAKVTDESWTNRDGTSARGWLLRGAEGAPAIVLLHAYGENRSYVLNLGVKMNEDTNFTILMPDLRGHGDNPPVRFSSFGGAEAEDTLAALDFLRGLKTESKNVLVGRSFGVYGVELGALSALSAAGSDENIKALALDSLPSGSDAVLASVIKKRFPFASAITAQMARLGAYPYFYSGGYARQPACETASKLNDRRVLLLAGTDAPQFQASAVKTGGCFPNQSAVEMQTDLAPSGYTIINATTEQSEAYDQRVIYFFKKALEGR